MAVHIITGLPGSGKTYFLVTKALKFLAEGRVVYSNFWIDWSGSGLVYWEKVQELQNVKDGVIIMDEAQIYFNARKWDFLDEKLKYKLQQHRKDGLDVGGSVQNIKRLDVVMRELVSHYYEVKRIGSLCWLRRFHIYDSEKMKREKLDSKWFILRKKFFQKYDTLKKIVPDYKDDLVVDSKMVEMKKCSVGRWHLVNQRSDSNK